MSFRVVSQRQLTQEEIEIYREARALLGRGVDRRELVKMMGLAGTVGAGLLLGVTPAHAFLPMVAIGAIFIGSQFVVQSAIAASFPVRNSEPEPVRGRVLVKLEESSGRIEQQEGYYVDVEAYAEITYNHSGFQARTVGQNEYSVKSSINQEQAYFEVIPQ